MRFKKYFDSLFVLSKSERNGALVLFAIVLLLIFFRFMIPILSKSNKRFELDYDQRISQLEKIKDSLNRKNSHSQNQKSKYNYTEIVKQEKVEKESNSKNVPLKMFQFNPNLVSSEELMQLGFPTYAAHNLMNYRDKGGVFRKSEDLKRIYGVDSALYANIQPLIVIPDQKAENKIKLEINSADSAAFASLPGIGPVYASRICKYRKYLGGFVKLDQLKEVYKLTEETYLLMKDYLTLDESKVQKIDINFANINELKKHPYCKYELARKIVDYRSTKGFIKSVEQLQQDSILENSTFNRLSPYLKVQ
jgi:competence protein ComEA